ncbi:helix-turn-helix domain-containing protein [Penicillium angulare]|uniref:helix-turn-helix domain-containing protein n=1 Tax=Penicillium angulare TaxID=116970 RepID=UPI00253F74C5|nr:helix-turn-helix domain-containing protein [Penicillium angulare]KAJ5273215.1 helix-turn-helix domain-containing protein [Penicillium angulare]
MSSSLYNTTVVPAKQALNALSNILRQAEQHENAAKLLDAALCEDMKPLSFQVSFSVQLAEKMVARLTESPIGTYDTNIPTFAEAQSQIEKAIKVLDAADETTINGNAEKTAEIGMGPGVNIPMRLENYAHAFSMSNLYFHVVTAYSILRKEGVPLGKKDYLGSFMGPYMPQGQGQ